MATFDINLALKIIPEFDGNSANLHKFLTCCDIIFKPLTENSCKLSFLNIVKTRLSGRAYDVVKYQDFSSWDILKSEFKKRFHESRSVEQIQIELVKIKQQKNESVRKYSENVERLLSDLNDACVESEGQTAVTAILNLNAKTALKAFQDGLKDPIKLIIKACRFTSLKEAISKAIEEEMSINVCTNSSNSSNYNSSSQNKKYLTKCKICSKVGHSEENCYFRTKTTTSQNLPSTSSSSYTKSIKNTTVICSYCKKPHHHIKNCRKRLYNESKGSVSDTPSHSIPSESQSENFQRLAQKNPNTAVRVVDI